MLPALFLQTTGLGLVLVDLEVALVDDVDRVVVSTSDWDVAGGLVDCWVDGGLGSWVDGGLAVWVAGGLADWVDGCLAGEVGLVDWGLADRDDGRGADSVSRVSLGTYIGHFLSMWYCNLLFLAIPETGVIFSPQNSHTPIKQNTHYPHHHEYIDFTWHSVIRWNPCSPWIWFKMLAKNLLMTTIPPWAQYGWWEASI